MKIPYWVVDSIFNQIFLDRFSNRNPETDPPNVQPWGAQPTNYDFQGGDFRGIIQISDFLLDIGINAIYLNPIFHSSSNHRYNTYDYYQIDLKLGDKKEFQGLLDLAHHNIIFAS
jgi:glycosidase